ALWRIATPIDAGAIHPIRVVSVQAERSECPETDTGRSFRLRLHRIGLAGSHYLGYAKNPGFVKA
ncbi:hypothetical protein, partial [Planktotalea frisia]|uniref:hypothetical protein n=1 Tax=Planktotalea frisia TaxID=696762 RepID=UPI001C31654E